MVPEIRDDFLPEKQLQLLQFLREFYQKNGSIPRLNAITEELGVTNKAALDLIDALEKKGRLVREGDVQSIRLLPTKDIFISYSSKDKQTALRVAEAFIRVGYTVWMDDMDIRIGEDIVQKVFQGIRECRFFLVLLSEHSITSHWVQDEISSARLREIEHGQTVVLPVVLSEGLSIPPSLKHKKYLKLTEKTFEEGMRRLLESIVLLNLRGTAGPLVAIENGSRDIEKEHKAVVADLQEKHWPEELAYKEWIIEPIPLIAHAISRKKMQELVNQHRIELQRYGGTGFPHETDYCDDKSIVEDGFYMFWKSEPNGLFTQRTTYDYWRMFENGVFIARQSLLEDAMFDERILSIEWLEMDIVRPMLFAKAMKNELKADAFKITLKIKGLKDRKLSILNRSRSGFHWDYRAKSNEMTLEATIDGTTDLLQTALDMTLRAVELFNWTNPNAEASRRDLKQLVEGKFPE